MKGGSNKLLLMIAAYLLITIVVFILFGPLKIGGTKTSASASVNEEVESRIIGNTGYVSTVERVTETSTEVSTETTVSTETSIEKEENSTEQGEAENTTAASTETAQTEENKEIHYYRFKVTGITTILRVRESGSMDAKVIAKFKNGREGYVLEKGEEWSKIVTKEGTFTGYCYNDYLEFTEIKKEEFLKEYVDQVK